MLITEFELTEDLSDEVMDNLSTFIQINNDIGSTVPQTNYEPVKINTAKALMF